MIIDGIDVSECLYYVKEHDVIFNDREKTIENYCYAEESACEKFDCYYKQLQRAKAENKMLINDLKSYQHWFDEQVQLNDSLQKVYQEEHVDNLNYKQALEEIREIVNELIAEVPEYHSCYYKDECGDKYKCTPKKNGEILYCCYPNVQKIEDIIDKIVSEAENDI